MLYRLFFIAIALLSPVIVSALDDGLKPEAEFSTRQSMAPFDSVDALLFNPTKIEHDLTSWYHGNWKVIRSETDLHAIYPYPVEYFVQELLNFENTKNTFPTVVDAVLENTSEDPFDRHALWVHIEIKVLGFVADYTYVTNNWMERSGNGYLQKYNLDRCPDDTLYQLMGSWYVEEIEYEGKPYTYIRNHAIIGIRKGSLPMEIAMRLFGVGQLKKVFANIDQAVEKRLRS